MAAVVRLIARELKPFPATTSGTPCTGSAGIKGRFKLGSVRPGNIKGGSFNAGGAAGGAAGRVTGEAAGTAGTVTERTGRPGRPACGAACAVATKRSEEAIV
jgi:hypothetical protein